MSKSCFDTHVLVIRNCMNIFAQQDKDSSLVFVEIEQVFFFFALT